MIDTAEMPTKLPSPFLPMQKQADTNSVPLIPKSNHDAEKSKDARPWKLTPPLKKRHIRISLDDDSTSPIQVTCLPKKTAPLVIKAKKTLTKHTKKNRSVRFSRVIKTRTLKKERTNLTAEQQSAMWYQNREYAEIDRDSLKNVQALYQVQGDIAKLPADDYCVRGLEMKSSPHIHRLRRLRASITVRAVLDQQNYQRIMGSTSDEALAMVSRQYTQQAQNRARELGLIDSIEACS